MFYRASAFPQFKNNFFFGCLVGERMIRVVLDGRRVVSQEDLLSRKYGRIRDVTEGPDGLSISQLQTVMVAPGLRATMIESFAWFR